MTRLWIALSVILALNGGAAAAGPAAVRRQAESSLLVTGSVSVDTAGHVTGFSLDQIDRLPPAIVELADRYIPQWTFEPVIIDGRPAQVTSRMSMRFVAKKQGDDSFSVELRSAAFGARADSHPDPLNRKSGRALPCPMTPPAYPNAALQAEVQANAYLLLQVDRSGKVMDAIAEQVNLRVVTDDQGMRRWRRTFADAALSQARRWCFEPMQANDQRSYQVFRVPVTFLFEHTPYGRWETYVPGPREPDPWSDEDERLAFSPDALPPGQIHAAGSGLRLLTFLSDR